jgi:hypothetical protein
MSSDDSEKTWDDYYERKKADRLREAALLDSAMRSAGVSDETILALDFHLFGWSRQSVDALAGELSENYTVDVVNQEQDYWLAICTTRPYGATLSSKQHLEWVEFMVDVGRSHACVFSTWTIEVPSLKATFRSEDIEDDA